MAKTALFFGGMEKGKMDRLFTSFVGLYCRVATKIVGTPQRGGMGKYCTRYGWE